MYEEKQEQEVRDQEQQHLQKVLDRIKQDNKQRDEYQKFLKDKFE